MAAPINRYSPDKPNYQSGLLVDPTSPIRVCSFQPSLPTPFATSPTLSSCSEARRPFETRAGSIRFSAFLLGEWPRVS
ncbi:hypothetical protein CRG98_014737 [Punica granatum]|uniref:Uncharacterized protein n=1 Tax=Punica granatum TaxID=22663 RepID=A0A2I0K9L9_PUNGR|nr:hypothetical protein CRG98_014737 [Punica granatum]